MSREGRASNGEVGVATVLVVAALAAMAGVWKGKLNSEEQMRAGSEGNKCSRNHEK